MFVVASSVAPRAQSGPSGQSSSSGSSKGQSTSALAHVDTALADRLAHGTDNEPVRVIVTLRAGAKQRGLLRALEAQGARTYADFSIIEGAAIEVPVGFLRALQNHPDVLTLSADANVAADSLSVGVSGAAQNTPYSLRRTLGLESTATPVTQTFQDGDSRGYDGTSDGGINSYYANTNYATASSIRVEVNSSAKRGMLLRFENLFGTG